MKPVNQLYLNNLQTWNPDTIKNYLSHGGKFKDLYEIIEKLASDPDLKDSNSSTKLLSAIKVLVEVGKNIEAVKTKNLIRKIFKKNNMRYIRKAEALGSQLVAEIGKASYSPYNQENAMDKFASSFIPATSIEEASEFLEGLANKNRDQNFYCTFKINELARYNNVPNRENFMVGYYSSSDGNIKFQHHSFDYLKNSLFIHKPYMNTIKGRPFDFELDNQRKEPLESLGKFYGKPINEFVPHKDELPYLEISIPPELIKEYQKQKGNFAIHLKAGSDSTDGLLLHKEVLLQLDNFLSDQLGSASDSRIEYVLNPEKRQDPVSSQALKHIFDYIYLRKNPLIPEQNEIVNKNFIIKLIEISSQLKLFDLANYLEPKLDRFE